MDGHVRRAIKTAREIPIVLWLLGFAAFLNMFGLSFLWPVNSIYVHTVLHKPLTVAGFVLMVWSGAGFIGSFFGGWLYDRIGAVRVLGGSLLLACAGILVPAFITGWWSYMAVMVLFGAACSVPFPILNTLVGHAWCDGGRRGYNFIYVCTNFGVAIGTMLGGLLAEWSFHAVFSAIALSYGLFFILVMTVFRTKFSNVHRAANTSASVVENLCTTSFSRTPWFPILMLFTAVLIAWSVYVQWMCTMPAYMQKLGYPLAWYSVLWTLNGVLVFALQPLVAVVVRKLPSLSLHISAGIVLFAASFAIIAKAPGYPSFVVGIIIMTIGELFAWPAIPTVVEQMAPAPRLGMFQGMTASAATLGRMVGPLAGGYAYDHAAPTTMLYLFMLAGLAASPCLLLFHRFYSRHRRKSAVVPQFVGTMANEQTS